MSSSAKGSAAAAPAASSSAAKKPDRVTPASASASGSTGSGSTGSSSVAAPVSGMVGTGGNPPAPSPVGFSHTNFVNDRFDVFGTLHYMSEKAHDGVRDFLVHRLYAMPDEDIEFVLPQLCHLYLVWSNDQGRGLGMFLAKKCAQSIHLAIKITWQLQASQPYVDDRAKQRANDLLQTCEMALVNASAEKGSDKTASKSRSASTTGTAAAGTGGSRPSSASSASRTAAAASNTTKSKSNYNTPPTAVHPPRASPPPDANGRTITPTPTSTATTSAPSTAGGAPSLSSSLASSASSSTVSSPLPTPLSVSGSVLPPLPLGGAAASSNTNLSSPAADATAAAAAASPSLPRSASGNALSTAVAVDQQSNDGSAGAGAADGEDAGGDDDDDDDGTVFVPPSDDSPSHATSLSPTNLKPLASTANPPPAAGGGATTASLLVTPPSSFEKHNSLPKSAFDARQLLLHDAKSTPPPSNSTTTATAAAAGAATTAAGASYKAVSDDDLKGYVVISTPNNVLIRANGPNDVASAASTPADAGAGALPPPQRVTHHTRATSASVLPTPHDSKSTVIAPSPSPSPPVRQSSDSANSETASPAPSPSAASTAGSSAGAGLSLSPATAYRSGSASLPAPLTAATLSSNLTPTGKSTALSPINEGTTPAPTPTSTPASASSATPTVTRSDSDAGFTVPGLRSPSTATTASASVSSSASTSSSSSSKSPAAINTTPPSGSRSAARSVSSPKSALVPLTPAQQAAMDEKFRRGTRDFELLLAKQLRSEYYTQELVLMSSLGRISEQLTKVLRPRRNEHLRAYIRTLDFNTAKGLYFPVGTMSDRHFKILSIPANEAVCLNSRDKAPFLMYIEIAYSGKKNSGTDLYKAYKNRVDDYVLSDQQVGIAAAAAAIAANAKSGNDKKIGANPTPSSIVLAASATAGTAKSSRHHVSSSAGATATAATAAPGSRASTTISAAPGSMSAKQRNALFIPAPHSPDASPMPSPPVSPTNGLSADTSSVPANAAAASHSANLPRSKSQILTHTPIPFTATFASPTAATAAAAATGAAGTTPNAVAAATAPTDPAAGTTPRHHISTPVMDPPASTPTGKTSPLLTFAPSGELPSPGGSGSGGTNPLSSLPAPALMDRPNTPVSTNSLTPPMPAPPSAAAATAAATATSSAAAKSGATAATAAPAAVRSVDRTLMNGGMSGSKPQVASSAPLRTHTIIKLDAATGKPASTTTTTVGSSPAAATAATVTTATAAGVKASPGVVSHSQSVSDIARLNRHTKFEKAFGELFHNRKKRLRAASPYGRLENWDLISVIFKGGDDCRQESLAMQLIVLFDKIFRDAKLPLFLQPYTVLVTSAQSGMIQTVPNSTSIDSLKKDTPNFTTLAAFFEQYFGPKGGSGFKKAQRNFVESMAAYSVVCYLLQIKDRHNGNILLTSSGHIVHIDFGFMLSNSPGGNINWESCPFKLTQEYVEVMEGEDSDAFNYYKVLLIRGFLEARKYAHIFLLLVQIMMREGRMACFLGGPATLDALRARFALHLTDDQCVTHAVTLVEDSINNWRTVQYDNYQRITNGIL